MITLLAIPFFFVAGQIINKGGIAQRMILAVRQKRPAGNPTTLSRLSRSFCAGLLLRRAIDSGPLGTPARFRGHDVDRHAAVGDVVQYVLVPRFLGMIFALVLTTCWSPLSTWLPGAFGLV